MRKSTKSGLKKKRSTPQQRSDGPSAINNQRLAQQTRKLLGKHYANKYWAG